MTKVQVNSQGKVYVANGKALIATEGEGEDDEYANYIQIENTIKGTSYVEATEIATACDDISYFLYGTANS